MRPREHARGLAGEGLRMVALSGASLALGYALTFALTEWVGFDARISYTAALVVCSIANFFACRHWVFRGLAGPLWAEALRFFPSVLAFRAFEVFLFSWLLGALPNYHATYFVTAAIAMAGKLLVSKLFIFRRPPQTPLA